jgi:Arc/MetJ family transcription regulator
VTKTLIEIDATLMAEAMQATGQTTKRATVTEALEQVVRRAHALDYIEQARSGITRDLDNPEVIAEAQR